MLSPQTPGFVLNLGQFAANMSPTALKVSDMPEASRFLFSRSLFCSVLRYRLGTR